MCLFIARQLFPCTVLEKMLGGWRLVYLNGRKLVTLAVVYKIETMKTVSKFERLRQLDEESQRLRESLGVSNRGEVIFQAPNSMWSRYDIVVEADGIGGAKLLVVEGNYPIDFWIKSERSFTMEDTACEAAEKLLEKNG